MTNTIDNSIAKSYIGKVNIASDLSKENDVKLKEQTDKFEAFFIKKVLDVSMKNDNPLFGKSAGDGIYHSMYNDAISESMGGKFGLSQILFNFLKQKG
ncbi:rod-binding protein [Sulfurospirillum sp. 1612]|uniref:rod-binding protein n=1 Tax=Sulfurospirillum sp. 1612 TaxID=3094835 RepID=UPI002F92B0B0